MLFANCYLRLYLYKCHKSQSYKSKKDIKCLRCINDIDKTVTYSILKGLIES